MSDQICINLPATGERICVSIPTLVLQPWDPNPPDPLTSRSPAGRVLPEPWIHSSDIKKESSRDLTILATLHAVSALLSPNMREAVDESIRQQVKRLSLPDYLEVRFGEREARLLEPAE